jgi:hypothetical protein
MFGFQRLDVYRCAAQFLGLAARLGERAPRGYGSLGDQLLTEPLELLERIVSMLTRMARG